jgi:hypothetical protein
MPEPLIYCSFMWASDSWLLITRSRTHRAPGHAYSRLSEAVIERRPTSATTARSLQLSFFERSEHRLLSPAST